MFWSVSIHFFLLGLIDIREPLSDADAQTVSESRSTQHNNTDALSSNDELAATKRLLDRMAALVEAEARGDFTVVDEQHTSNAAPSVASSRVPVSVRVVGDTSNIPQDHPFDVEKPPVFDQPATQPIGTVVEKPTVGVKREVDESTAASAVEAPKKISKFKAARLAARK